MRSNTEELAAERQVDVREPRTLDKLQAAICDWMVMSIVAGDQAEQEEEEDSNNMDLENNQENNYECESYQELDTMENFSSHYIRNEKN